MPTPSFDYTIYLTATADEVWRALTDPEFTRLYWGNHRNASDWQPGSSWRHEDYDDPSIVDVVGKVVEAEPPTKLVCTWSMLGDAHARGKRPSVVSYTIHEDSGVVKLTLSHAKLGRSPELRDGVSEGWPAVLSSLKSLLETGKALPPFFVREGGTWRRTHFGEPAGVGPDHGMDSSQAFGGQGALTPLV